MILSTFQDVKFHPTEVCALPVLGPFIASLCPVLEFPHHGSFPFPDIYLAASFPLTSPHSTWGPSTPVRGRRGARGTKDSGPSRVGHFVHSGRAPLGTEGLSWVSALKTGLPPPPGRELTFSEAGAGVYNYCPPPRQGRRPANRPRWRWRRGRDNRCRQHRLCRRASGVWGGRRRRQGVLKGSCHHHPRLTGQRRRHGGEARYCACAARLSRKAPWAPPSCCTARFGRLSRALL